MCVYVCVCVCVSFLGGKGGGGAGEGGFKICLTSDDMQDDASDMQICYGFY